MVYKKYIKRDGKLYGPYIYESKRIDGKVVSEYHGPKREFNLKRYAWIFASAIFVVFLAYFLSTFDFSGLTGQAVLNTEINYTENQPIKGNVVLSLREGELLPTNSKLILENSGQIYEYNLNDLVSNQPSTGKFYIEGVSLSGTGEGYGIEGERQVYPEVSFILQIYPSSGGNQTPVQEENISQQVLNESTNVSEPVSQIEATPAETISNESVAETSPITGFFARIYNFFIALTPTGRAISESNEVSGKTSFNNPFVYNLSGGEGVQLKSGSVSVSGNAIPDESVQIKVTGNQVLVETSYSEIEKGFGQEFLGNNIETLNIDLSSLGLVLNDGELIAKIVYGNDEIISNSITLISGAVDSNLTNISNSTIMNVTIEQRLNETPTNFTQIIQEGPQIITAASVQFILTENEKVSLAEKYGDVIVQTTRSEIVNGKLVKRYEIGNDWIEYSYNPNVSETDLETQISIDKMKWLKDLAGREIIKKQAP